MIKFGQMCKTVILMYSMLLFFAMFLPAKSVAQLPKPSPDADATPVVESRILGGIVVAGASSVDPQAKLFVDGAIQIPLVTTEPNAFVTLWGQGKISSIAQAGSLSSFSAVSTYVSPVLANPSQMVQSGEVNGGFGIRVTPIYSESDAEWKPWSVNAIVGGGFITPLSPSQAQPSFFQATTEVQSSYSQYASQFATACKDTSVNPAKARTCYVAFLPRDRSSFYRQYSAGLRYKKYWTDASSGNTDTYLFPAMLDVTLGQNEYVTGGGLRGAVLHVGGSSPIPGHAFVTIGFGADLRITGVSNISSPILLIPPGSTTALTVTSDTVVDIPIPQPDRDRYLFTIALDLKKIISIWAAKK